MNNKRLDTDGVLAGIENSAISVLNRAVDHDKNSRLAAALACYQEGIQLFLDVIKKTDNESKRGHYRTKATEYMSRAEKIKQLLQKEKELETYHEQIQIRDNATGFSYETIFKKYFDESVTEIEVEDPYIRTVHQTYNFLSFCELTVKHCSKLKTILLITGPLENDHQSQKFRFCTIGNSLKERGIELVVQYSTTLHDREIRLNNGWIIKIGRGLDIYKGVKKFNLGFCDQSLRHCHETTVDVFYRNK